ncbi:MAG: acyl-CoA dehydrogenase, partial [Thalassovita sp.]|nr:acyl-CoA dehydrogenase [Thalassovita sp.]
MTYRAQVEDIRFVFDHVAGLGLLRETEKYAEASDDLTDAVLEGMGKLCEEVIYPTQRDGDLTPAVLENGVVRTSPGF